MLSYLILFPSLTRAQQAAAVLSRARVNSRLVRAPRGISSQGCGYAVILGQGELHRGLNILAQAGLAPGRVHVTAGDGNYEEVEL